MNISIPAGNLILKVVCIFLLLLPVNKVFSTPSELIREVAVQGLPDIAIASFDQHGPVIYYNPELNIAAGPWLSEFFMAHEHFHHRLGHLQRDQFVTKPFSRIMLRQKFEHEADCEAAKVVSPYAVLAAVEYFVYIQGPTRVDALHPTGYERAETIRLCGGER